MAKDAVGRTGAVPAMGGFAGRHPDQPSQRQPEAPAEEQSRPARDEVCVRSDGVGALKLLRERVLACTRRRLGIGQVSVPKFAEVVEIESIDEFLSRLLSDQNQLGACSLPVDNSALRRDLNAAFESGVTEARELLAEVPGEGLGAVEQVAAEFARRLAELDS